MQIGFAALSTTAEGALVVGALEGGALTPAAAAADTASGGALTRANPSSRFTGKPGQFLEILAPSGMRGLAHPARGTRRQVRRPRRAESTRRPAIVARLSNSGEKTITFAIDGAKGKLKPGELAAHIAMGAQLRSYSFNAYRTKGREEYMILPHRASPSAAATRRVPSAPGHRSKPFRAACSSPAISSTNRRTCSTRPNSRAAPRRSSASSA